MAVTNLGGESMWRLKSGAVRGGSKRWTFLRSDGLS